MKNIQKELKKKIIRENEERKNLEETSNEKLQKELREIVNQTGR
jgi:hypothetical protein